MAKNKKVKKAPVEEHIPEGMRKEDYADAAFRKKVTIIMCSILLVFVIGVAGVLVKAWVDTEKHNKEFERLEQAFVAEKDSILARLQEIDANGGTFEDRAEVKITLTKDNFSDWISLLDSTYQLPEDDPGYAAYKGATIEVEGLFITRDFSGNKEYWVYRLHSHESHEGHDHSEDVDESTCEKVPLEVIFLDSKAEVPEDGAWVKVTGVVGPSTLKNLSAVRNAVVTVMDEAGDAHLN